LTARLLYSRLWDAYIAENPHLLEVIVGASGLSDVFGQEGNACQASELWRIRNAHLASSPAAHSRSVGPATPFCGVRPMMTRPAGRS
jgi:hypothetical protein